MELHKSVEASAGQSGVKLRPTPTLYLKEKGIYSADNFTADIHAAATNTALWEAVDFIKY